MKNKNYIQKYLLLTTAVMTVTTISAFAASSNNNANYNNNNRSGMMRGNNERPMMRPEVFGTVSAVSGNSVTVTSVSFDRGFGRVGNATSSVRTSNTTYTVDVSGATILKNNATSSVSSILVGDTVTVQGTINGTSVKATLVRDGVMNRNGEMNAQKNGGRGMGNASSSIMLKGNGQPIVAGKVSAINGSTLTITNKSNVTYTIDATNANISQNQVTATLSNVAVGDDVVVQGSINGTSVIASTIMNHKMNNNYIKSSNNSTGFFDGVGQFFVHLFGF